MEALYRGGCLFSNSETDAHDLAGLRIIAGLLIALGCLFVLYALLFLFLIFADRSVGEGIRARQVHWRLVSTLISLACAAFSYLCFRTSKGLRDARRWAANVTMAIGVLFLLFSGNIMYDQYHPYPQAADEYFGILLVPFLVAVSLWWCIYLNLPRVRAAIAAARQP